MQQQKQSVNVTIDSALGERNKKKMEVLETMVETVLLCGRQNCAMRGHRDDQKHTADPTNNAGNFRAFLQYRVNGGDTLLQEHFQHVNYFSK